MPTSPATVTILLLCCLPHVLSQLYSTASYQAKDIHGIGLPYMDLTGWSFAGQNLSGADLSSGTLTNADFTGSTVAGANFSSNNLTSSSSIAPPATRPRTFTASDWFPTT